MKKLRILVIVVFFMVLVVSLTGCAGGDQKEQKAEVAETKVEIERIFMHDINYFSFLVASGTERFFRVVNYRYLSHSLRIFQDVQNEQKPYYIRRGYYIEEIHIRRANDINGAGWNHGKDGHGQTIPINNN